MLLMSWLEFDIGFIGCFFCVSGKNGFKNSDSDFFRNEKNRGCCFVEV